MVSHSLRERQRSQLGVITRRQLVEHGHAASTFDRRVAAGELRLVFPGVAMPSVIPLTWDHRAIAARLWVGGEAVLARSSAGHAWGLRTPRRVDDGRVHLLVHSRTPDAPPGIVVHRTSRPIAPWVEPNGPHLTTSPTRTICDLAHDLTELDLRRLLSHAVREGLTSAAAMRDAFIVLGRFRGVALLRQLVDELSPLESRSRSDLESLYLRQTTRLGIPPTAMNHPVIDIYGKSRFIDAVYLPQRQPVELDSMSEHGTLLDWNDDIRRQNAIVLDDTWRAFLRYSWTDLTQHLDRVEHELRTVLSLPIVR